MSDFFVVAFFCCLKQTLLNSAGISRCRQLFPSYFLSMTNPTSKYYEGYQIMVLAGIDYGFNCCGILPVTIWYFQDAGAGYTGISKVEG